ncbi:hypothetical protein [Tenacibaculum geojense]|uniref:DUF3592 domain-containing protein n=1 Tax=Tenacibaculum geojense TaxID=915352 RepID=A0ABW3JQZ5_9FLAO
MKKITINHSLLFLLIPICMFVFVGVPQLQRVYNDFEDRALTLEKDIAELDSLQQLGTVTSSSYHRFKTLEITVPIHKKSLLKERYTYYKTGGMLLVLAIMFTMMFRGDYIAKKKKKAKTNKQITFTYEDPDMDAIGQSISWDPVKSSGSNFYSQQLKETSYGYKITATSTLSSMPLAFVLIGLNYVAWTFLEFFKTSDKSLSFMEGGKLFFTSGGLFLIIGLILFLFFGSHAFFYKRKRVIILDRKIPFQEVYALQVLQKFVQGNQSGGYYCYELNLVTNSGERINLLNHGDKEYFLSDMVKISKLLKVPVWNYGVQ